MTDFQQNNYAVLRKKLSPDLITACQQYIRIQQAKKGYFNPEEDQLSLGKYGDPLMESLLPILQPILEEQTGLTLWPTYSYVRIYRANAQLVKHKDRHACEISTSVTIDEGEGEKWPIFLETPTGTMENLLRTGDMLIYKGIEQAHWRPPLKQAYWVQAFFHYVDANGNYASQKFDKRAAIGAESLKEKMKRFHQKT